MKASRYWQLWFPLSQPQGDYNLPSRYMAGLLDVLMLIPALTMFVVGMELLYQMGGSFLVEGMRTFAASRGLDPKSVDGWFIIGGIVLFMGSWLDGWKWKGRTGSPGSLWMGMELRTLSGEMLSRKNQIHRFLARIVYLVPIVLGAMFMSEGEPGTFQGILMNVLLLAFVWMGVGAVLAFLTGRPLPHEILSGTMLFQKRFPPKVKSDDGK